MDRIYIGNDHTVTLTSLKDEDGAAVTSATVTVTLYEADRTTEVGGASWPVSLTHTSAGTYEGSLSRNAEVTAGKTYWVKATAQDNGRQFVAWQQAYATIREA